MVNWICKKCRQTTVTSQLSWYPHGEHNWAPYSEIIKDSVLLRKSITRFDVIMDSYGVCPDTEVHEVKEDHKIQISIGAPGMS
jgi:hypothetical protein